MHTASQSDETRPAKRWADWLARAAPLAALICFAVWCFIAIRPTHLWDDAEPEVLNQAWRLAQGKPVYKDIESPPYILAAYPPVYLAITAAALKLTGLSALPGKFISILAALAIGLAFARLSREWHGQTRRGWLMFCVLLIVPAFLYNTARVHVQMLAVALSIWSLLFLLRGKLLDVALLSPLLAVLAIYTKQTQIALPLAAGIYLLRHQPRRAAMYAAALAVMGLPPLFLLQQATDGYFLRHTVEWNSLTYTFTRLVLAFLQHVGPAIIFLVLAARVVKARTRQRRADHLDFYFIAAVLLAIASLGRIGAHTQYVVELHCVTLLVLLRAGGFDPKLAGVLQVAGLLIYTPVFMGQKAARALPAYAAAPAVHARLRQVDGPIISEQAGFAPFSGRELYIQLFHFSALARMGRWDESPLVRQIAARQFAFVITEFPLEDASAWRSRHAERFNPRVRQAILENYRRSASMGPYFLYQPRP